MLSDQYWYKLIYKCIYAYFDGDLATFVLERGGGGGGLRFYFPYLAGADPGFQVRGGALKKIAPSRGRRENCWGISCEKSTILRQKIIFFQFYGGRAKFLGYFMWKITILRQKNHIFTNFRGGARRVRPPPPSPLNPPLLRDNT